MIFRTLLTTAIVVLALPMLRAQVVNETPVLEIKGIKGEVTALAISPKEDAILVGTTEGAVLYDLEKGKKLHAFPFSEDGGTTVWHVADDLPCRWVRHLERVARTCVCPLPVYEHLASSPSRNGGTSEPPTVTWPELAP